MNQSQLPCHNLKEFQQALRERMRTVGEKMVSEVERTTHDPFVLDGARHLNVLINSKGKGIRGYVAYHMYRAAGGNDYERILQAGTAIELFHLFALVHDDVIDRSKERRGIATVEAYTRSWLREHEAIGEVDHASASQAILWGDYLLALSQQLLQECGFPATYQAAGQRIFQQMFTDVVIGQMLDVEMTTKKFASREEVETKTMLKTAYYTFVHPMKLGAAFAGANGEFARFAETFGQDLGMGFQIQDDLFDITLLERDIHKPVLNDIRAGQHTVFSDYIDREGDSESQRQLAAFFGKEIRVEDADTVRTIFAKSGAIAHGKSLMEACFDRARAAVNKMPLMDADKKVWCDLVDLVATRTS